MVRIDTVPIRRPTELVKDKEAPLDGLEINMSFSQMLKGKEQAVQEQKTEKDDGPCKTEEADSIKKKPLIVLVLIFLTEHSRHHLMDARHCVGPVFRQHNRLFLFRPEIQFHVPSITGSIQGDGHLCRIPGGEVGPGTP